jgi:predicted ATP-dependent endonuclease of OLD family
MHCIQRLKVENFKSIRNAEIKLSNYTPLVGCNNVGKTNIMQALVFLLRKTSLDSTDFFDQNLKVTVEASIVGINEAVLADLEEKHRDKIKKYITDESIEIRRVQLKPNVSTKDLKWEIAYLEDGIKVWAPNPAGIEQAISDIFPEPIWIGAMEDAAEDAGKMGAGTTIGKLLKEIVDSVSGRHAGSISAALADVAQHLAAESENKDQDLKSLDDAIAAELKSIFPGITAKTHIPIPEFPEFMKGATVKIFEPNYAAENGRDVRAMGHGAQRAVQIALVKCLANRKNNSASKARTTLLLLDEPELYLHPQAVETIRAALAKLAQEGYQVVFTTHSGSMIARDDAPNVSLVRRTSDKGTYCLPTLAQSVKNAIAEAEHQSVTLFELTNSSKFLFAEIVLLIEGKTEQILLPEIHQVEFSRRFEADRIEIIDVRSASNLSSTIKVLENMGIPTKAVADLDFAFRAAIDAKLISREDEDIRACREIFKRLESEGKVKLDGGLPTKGNGKSAAQGYEELAASPDALPYLQALREKLRVQKIWIWPLGAIEKQLDLKAKSSTAEFVRFIKNLPDKEFRDGIIGYGDVKAMLDWAREVA